uniref:DnaJ homolog subfamily B member 9 n=1 Tax=Fundulus heteroclitus TaxID=8078 RepID=A0A3Q2UPQ8_FUNHE
HYSYRLTHNFSVCIRCIFLTARSYYDSLNVESTATTSQIKKSFRSLAVRYHPDKNKSAQAENTFREIAEGKQCFQINAGSSVTMA